MPFISETLAQFVPPLRREEFGLAEMEPAVYNDAGILALSDKVIYEADPDSGYPGYCSRKVIITLSGGRQLRHRADGTVARAQAILYAVLLAHTVRTRRLETVLSERIKSFKYNRLQTTGLSQTKKSAGTKPGAEDATY